VETASPCSSPPPQPTRSSTRSGRTATIADESDGRYEAALLTALGGAGGNGHQVASGKARLLRGGMT
jgi:Ser/Thr protein kinase RdoA (MazF antagonist)